MEWQNKSVLIAEDEDTNFMLLEEYLEPTGIKIVRAIDGIEALKFYTERMPDLILLDIKLPRMNGYEVVNRIREHNTTIPIIAQTAYTMRGDREKILKTGCTDYISKPIEEEALLNKMRHYLS